MTARLQPLDPVRTPIDNAFYDAVGDAWWDPSGPFSALHEMNPVRVAYFDRVFAGRLGPPDTVRVLDVGCGGGLVSEALARQGYRVTGVDLSDGAIAAATRHARGERLALSYQVGRADVLPAEDGTVDAIVASDIFEHLHDLGSCLAEINRVLRPGGVLAYDTINRTARSWFVMILAAEWLLRINKVGTHNWHMFIRPDELARLLVEHGLSTGEHIGLAPARPVPAATISYLRTRRLGGYHLTGDDSASYIGYAVKPAGQHEE